MKQRAALIWIDDEPVEERCEVCRFVNCICLTGDEYDELYDPHDAVDPGIPKY